MNSRVGPYEVDFLWPAESLIVETDGFRYHASRAAFERDRERDGQLQALGYRVVRITHRQLSESPRDIAGTIRGMLKP